MELSTHKRLSKLPSSQYKGVVPQPNGRWGAQIYEKHQRVWLGTFNEEAEAAWAYDVAAQRYRGPDAVTNFTQTTALELAFLASHSKAEIADMLRKHTYYDELQQTKTIEQRPFDHKGRHLFDKVVTPSDVGKLNRLVIPKQQAEKHFPLGGKGILLNFEDYCGKVWRFRYSYWNSSQSYVLTKGWSRFVKDKGLRAGDVVSFRRSEGEEGRLFIDWSKCGGIGGSVVRLFGVDIRKATFDSVGSAKVVCAEKRRGEREENAVVKKICVKES